MGAAMTAPRGFIECTTERTRVCIRADQITSYYAGRRAGDSWTRLTRITCEDGTTFEVYDSPDVISRKICDALREGDDDQHSD
jgi:hypothetical protein